MLMPDVGETLAEVFGFAALRPGQGDIIRDVMQGRPVVAVMPTGAGKSLCYQLPAVLLGRDGAVTLVVSPLIALMRDQVESLRARGVQACALTSAMTAAEQSDALAGIRTGQHSLVYVAPERFRSPRFVDALADLGARLALLAIDEAHCISEWGHEFRPDYRRLGQVVAALRPPRVVALTATATAQVRADIAEQLGLSRPAMHVHGFDRPNLYYAVEPAGGCGDKSKRLFDLIRLRQGGAALVYAATRKNAERYAAALDQRGLRVRVYHAGLDDESRHAAQDTFMAGSLDAIVATNAFGMGVNKADIRLVVHADLPRSIEAYYQESGRGGRDGERTECVLLFNHGDARLQEFLIAASHPSAGVLRGVWRALRQRPELGADPERLATAMSVAARAGPPHPSTIAAALRVLVRHGFALERDDGVEAIVPSRAGEVPELDAAALERRADVERGKLRAMTEYGYAPRCRRQFMLDYFGDADWANAARRCAACDNCVNRRNALPLSPQQRDDARALLHIVARLRGRFGRAKIARVANGSDDDPRLAKLAERGALSRHSVRSVLDLLRALEGADLVAASSGEYPTVSITAAGRGVVAGHVELKDVVLMPRPSRPSRSPRAAPTEQASAAPLDSGIAARLRALRLKIAKKSAVPAYVVFSDKTLEAIARSRPLTQGELAAVPGIGPSRLQRYGDPILDAVRGDS